MKKLFLSILMIVVLAAIPAHSATYTLSTGVPADSGNTTVANGGVSVFALNNTSGSYDLYPQIDRTYAYGFQLTSILPSQAASVGDWSGTTFSVFAKFKSESDDVPWNDVEPHYLYKDEAVSGNTPEMRWLQVPPADRARVYFVSEGGSAFGLGAAKLIASEIPLQIVEPVIVIKEDTFTMPANGTGVSTFITDVLANIKGAGHGEFSLSGASRFYTADGKTTPSVSGTGIHCADLEGFSLSADEIKKLKIAPSSSACTISYKLLNRDPSK